MGFDWYAQDMIRRKLYEEGKRCVYVPDDAREALPDDRACLRVITRVNVAFLTPREYRAWRKRQRGTP